MPPGSPLKRRIDDVGDDATASPPPHGRMRRTTSRDGLLRAAAAATAASSSDGSNLTQTSYDDAPVKNERASRSSLHCSSSLAIPRSSSSNCATSSSVSQSDTTCA